VHVARGRSDVVLVVPAPAQLSGALEPPAAAGRVLVSLCQSSRETDGELCVARRLFPPLAERYELERLAPGDYSLVAEIEGHPALRLPVAIESGATVEGPRLAWQ
jgi:hypothetical protein